MNNSAEKFGQNLINNLKGKQIINSDDTYMQFTDDAKTTGLLSITVELKKTPEEIAEYVDMLITLVKSNVIDIDKIIDSMEPLFPELKYNLPALSHQDIGVLALYIHGYINGVVDYFAVQKQIDIKKSYEEIMSEEIKIDCTE